MSTILWSPSPKQIVNSKLTAFSKLFAHRIGRSMFGNFSELHQESVNFPNEFWSCVWDYCGVIGQKGQCLLTSGPHMTDARWFPDGKLNFAENLLRPDQCANGNFAQKPAIICCDERGQRQVIIRSELLDLVSRVVSYLSDSGVIAGDRVAAVLPNRLEAIVVMLAATSLGAIFSSCSPDFGPDAIADRFTQIEPKILVTTQSCQYNGKAVKPWERVQSLIPRLPSVERVLLVQASTNEPTFAGVPVDSYEAVLQRETTPIRFRQFPFEHPVFILYSSGTTGAPKCIVHGAGGTLLQHMKEHQLHSDIQPDDRLMYYTTTGWMMWNWLVTALASEAIAVLYDGSPLYPDWRTLFKIAEQNEITHFGASAKYFATLDKDYTKVGSEFALQNLRCILSTGSPLLPETFDYVYSSIKSDICLASISGGTDIVSCFALGCPNLPVRRGELQSKGLGMDVAVFDEIGQPVIGQAGELVCRSSFPSMPVSFWNDPGKRKYLSSYFGVYDNVWCHGDWAEETANGGMIIYGRSDATLNPGGVRIGTAEIYQQVESFPEVQEALATALRRNGDEQIVLFVRCSARTNANTT